jgi:hypothetical protein
MSSSLLASSAGIPNTTVVQGNLQVKGGVAAAASSVAGNESVGGNLTVAGTLNVAGAGVIGTPFTTTSLTVNGNLAQNNTAAANTFNALSNAFSGTVTLGGGTGPGAGNLTVGGVTTLTGILNNLAVNSLSATTPNIVDTTYQNSIIIAGFKILWGRRSGLNPDNTGADLIIPITGFAQAPAVFPSLSWFGAPFTSGLPYCWTSSSSTTSVSITYGQSSGSTVGGGNLAYLMIGPST